MRFSALGAFCFILIFISPFLILTFYIKEWSLPELEQVLPVLIFTALQAVGSTIGAMLLGVSASLGYLTLQNERRRFFYRKLILGFAALPSLFWITAYFWWSQNLGAGVEGLFPIVVCHAFLNFALVTLGSERIVHLKLGRLAEVSQAMGVRPWRFWSQIAGPLVWKEHFLLAIVIFSLCFSSLSVPLIFSSPDTPTLEVLIARWALREGQWGAALSLGILQWVIIAALSWLILPASKVGRWQKQNWRVWVRPEFQLTLFLPSFFILLAYISFFRTLLEKKFWLDFTTHFSWVALAGSWAITMGVIFLSLLFFLFMSLVGPSRSLRYFLRSYSAPSTAIMALCLILLPGTHPLVELFKISLGCTLLSFPVLYRTMIDTEWSVFLGQWTLARLLGASHWLIVRDVWWPQAQPMVSTVVGLAVLWGISDFALAGLVLQRPYSLALLAENALNSYNVELGQAYTLLCLILGIAFYIFFERISRVRTKGGS